ncbi:MAG: sulfite exporter TauE/SafE family protein [Bacteroidia bacterium]|nr:sulfite exporter TauE/SafE family protein [Bacteroidia bacterium]
MLEIFGYLGAVLMGISLGLIGGGGSILTVPILVYLFGVNAELSTAYSLFIVGLTSLFGSFSHMRMGNIHWRTAIVFGIPSIISVYLTRHFVVPAIPNPVFGGLSKDLAILIFFAIIMVAASYSMIRKGKPKAADETEVSFNYPMILAEGLIVGMVTGLVGAGGGFLIIPALVLLAKLPMKQAVGTSLIIIASKSLLGFLGDLGRGAEIDWIFMLTFSAIAVVGIFSGAALSKKISGDKLKPAFGWFVLIMGIYIIVNSLMSMK